MCLNLGFQCVEPYSLPMTLVHFILFLKNIFRGIIKVQIRLNM